MFKRIIQIIFYAFFKPIFWIYVYVFQHVRFNKNGFKVPKGPVVFLSNHHSNWDGLYLNIMFFDRIIHYIVHDEMFKNKPLRFLSGTLLGEVRRGANHQDVGPVKELLRLKREGKSVGIYPEGDIHMFGRTLPVAASIAKLVKKLDCPVVILSLTGAHLRATRVAKYPYHSHITYTINDIIMPNQLENMEIEDLHQRIVDGITVDEMKWQRQAKVKQRGQKRAEWMELGLFMCPKCHRLETIKSSGNTVFCSKCDFTATLNPYSFFESEFPMDFDCTSLWDDWQLKELENLTKTVEADVPFLQANNLDFFETKVGEFFDKPIDQVDIRLYPTYFEYKRHSENISHQLPLKDITRSFLQYKDVLEIVNDDMRIRFGTKKWKWSAYLWTKAMAFLLNREQSATEI